MDIKNINLIKLPTLTWIYVLYLLPKNKPVRID